MVDTGIPLKERLAPGGRRVWVIGHRGAMGYRPENTMASWEHALELGADWIELDVHLSRDGQLAVIHDDAVDRTTNGHGQVKDLTMEQLKQLDAGSWFAPTYAAERIATLPEVLRWAHARGTVVDIEIKNGPHYYPGIEEAVVAELARTGMTEQVIVISFDHQAVKRVKELEGRVATGVLYVGRPVNGVQLAREARADALLPNWGFVVAEDVRKAHDAGLAVAPWTSSDPDVLTRLIDAGVDGIGTNHPDVLRRVLDARGAAGASVPAL